jgi:hypothetical protein
LRTTTYSPDINKHPIDRLARAHINELELQEQLDTRLVLSNIPANQFTRIVERANVSLGCQDAARGRTEECLAIVDVEVVTLLLVVDTFPFLEVIKIAALDWSCSVVINFACSSLQVKSIRPEKNVPS